MKIKFAVRPDTGVAPTANSASIGVEANYSRTVPNVEGQPSEPLLQAVRVALDTAMQGATTLEDAASAQVHANVLAVDGSLIFSRSVDADNAGNAALIFTQADVNLCSNRQQAVPADRTPLVCARTVRLVPTGETKVDYSRSSVMVSPVRDEQAITATTIDTLLKIAGGRISSLDVTGQKLEQLTRVAWVPAHLAVDGTFTCAFIQQASIGWLWWLAGDQQVIGFVPDDLSKQGERSLAIALPALSTPRDLTNGVGDNLCECNDRVPLNVTESEVANNPGIYTEDPGAFCKPFSNPERVLSEKSFSVVARATQPEIGALATSKTKSVRLLNLEGDERISTESGGTIRRLTSLLNPSRIATSLPRLVLPTRYSLPAPYTDFINSLPSGRTLMDAKHPLQWEDDIAQYQATTVSLGHILEFRIRWRSNGYSLGTVAKTLTLAPRQAKRIQKIEWERSERARRSERTQLTDVENDSVTRERDYQDQVSANLSEWARGASHSDTEAIAGGIGFFGVGILGGVGGGAGSSNSSSHQEGGRDTSASEHQRLRDAIRRHGDALRKFESTVVNEVTQEETVTGTTEVVRNLNYAHSLTVIYYQILRHLKVNTEFAGVRECLFVPFAVKAFDTQRAYRWREAIQFAIRSSRYLRALRYLKDVATNFSTSDIPPGTRAEQPLTYLRGSIFLNLAIERPKDTADSKYDDARWNAIKPLLGTPALGIFSQLIERVESDRDRYFQDNFAPAIAAKWANGLRLRIGSTTVAVDSTLATRYQFNRGVRIDFVAPLEQIAGLRRTDLQNVTVLADHDLPPGSVANLTRMSFTYATARFQRAVQASVGTDDLIAPGTGQHDQATAHFPLDAWESVNERLEITRSVQDLVEHLNEHVEYYHKAIWWRMDRDRLMMMLDGFYVPNTNNVSIATVVDREPIGIIGNCLVYRVGVASFIGCGSIKAPADLYNLYAQKQPVRDPVLVSLPTDGLYAQTIMDECLALEEHFGNLDWALNDKDPELGAIDPSLLTTRRADQTAATAPTPFPSTIINLQNAPDAPAPSGLQGVLNAVTNPNAFRDMAGLAATQANAQAAFNTAASLATNFGNQAAALELAKMAKSQEATRTADQKLATIQRAKEKGLTNDVEAATHAKEVLSSMNPDTPKGEAPHENPAINSAIDAAKNVPGSTIEANTGEGGVKVKVGGEGDTSGISGNTITQTLPTPQNFANHVGYAGRFRLRATLNADRTFSVELINDSVDFIDFGPIHARNETHITLDADSPQFGLLIPMNPQSTSLLYKGRLDAQAQPADIFPGPQSIIAIGLKTTTTKSVLQYHVPFASGVRVPCVEGRSTGTHTGATAFALDLGAPRGTTVVAAMDGIVADLVSVEPDMPVGTRGNPGTENQVRIRHTDMTYGIYAHLLQNGIQVNVGDRVTAGTVLGRSGNSGNTNGDHLHFAVERATMTGFETVDFDFFNNGGTAFVPNTNQIVETVAGPVTGQVLVGTINPNGSTPGDIGDIYIRTNGTPGATYFVKESGASGTTAGWTPKASFP